jgi:vacuolar-type H+-ATPase subunit E/Vma4
MTSMADRTDTALAPLRQELLRAAHADAEAALAAARQAADQAMAAARAEATRLVAAGRAEGTRAGEAVAADTLVRARAQARARQLAARRELLEALRREVTARLLTLRTGPAYEDLRAVLTGRARELLGPGVTLTEPPGGGVIATAPGRRVDLSLTTLADLAVGLSTASAEGLWAP